MELFLVYLYSLEKLLFTESWNNFNKIHGNHIGMSKLSLVRYVSMCVSHSCLYNQEINLAMLVSFCLYMKITSCVILFFNQTGAESCQLVSSLSIAIAICVKLCIPYLVIPWVKFKVTHSAFHSLRLVSYWNFFAKQFSYWSTIYLDSRSRQVPILVKLSWSQTKQN